MSHLHKIFNKLHLTRDNGLFITQEDTWENLFSNRIERLLKKVIKPEAFFCIDNKPFILFFNSPTNKINKLKEIWNFNESPIVMICENDVLEIYNGFEYITEKETLRYFGSHEKLNDFSYFELVTGKTWEKYRKDFSYNNRIDYHLLNNIRSTRDLLITLSISPTLANSLLGKVIFVRYLIDRGVKLDYDKKGKSRNWTNSEFCELLTNKDKVIDFFNYLSSKFNGNLFPISEIEMDSISDNCLLVLKRLLSGEEISSGQISLFNFYDFSIIPVEFISNIYELFIGQTEQEKSRAYYTPLFLVDYILSETVEKNINNNFDSCKVLDPSCGSGIFLVETLRKIIEQFHRYHPSYINQSDEYKSNLKKLVTSNIYGVDKDKNAIDIAIFSIYLTLLDYQKPSDIETFTFPQLYNTNLFSDDFFNQEARFNKKFKSIKFDFILGNPPWKRGKGEGKPLFDQYINHRKELEKGKHRYEIEISNSEIAQAFILRVGDFCNESTQIGFIATSKILYNLRAKNFRRYLLDRFFIDKIFELAPVRKEVFDKSNDKAVGPATIIFYRKAKDDQCTDENIIEHLTLKPSRFFSLFKVFTIQRGDYKEVNQKQLKDFDYLWKILVYGNYLDFNLINRLKKSYLTLGEIVIDKENFLVGQGAMVGGGDMNDSSYLIGKPFLDTKKDIKSFWINEQPSNMWNFTTAHRPRNRKLYTSPFLLITGGTDKYFRSVSAVSKKDAVFRSSITAIKRIKGNSRILNSMCAVLNSSFYAYYGLQTFSSLGIEREESHDEENLNIPFTHNNTVSNIVSKLSELKNKYYSSDDLINNMFEDQIQEYEKKLDSLIINEFSFSDQEKALLKYSNDIVIPMLMKHNGFERIFNPISSESQEMNDYINLFINRFNNIYEKTNQKIIVEIKHTDQLIGLFFKLVSLSQKVKTINLSKTKNTEIIKTVSSLGNDKITDQLFVRKDVRGFDKSSFYIVKPNEQRLWHKAIAYLDLNEFIEAVLIAGKNNNG